MTLDVWASTRVDIEMVGQGTTEMCNMIQYCGSLRCVFNIEITAESDTPENVKFKVTVNCTNEQAAKIREDFLKIKGGF